MKTLIMATIMLLGVPILHAQNSGIFPEHVLTSVENEALMNSKASEFGVMEWKGKFCFTTNRNQFSARNEYLGEASYSLVTYDEKRNYRKVYPFETFERRNNVGSISQVSNGRFYFTAENKKADYNLKAATKTNSMTIYEAKSKDGSWKISPVKATRDKKYSCIHPTLSRNGQSMYFASDMPGGFGGMDLYVIHRTEKGWTEPQNLGSGVNTDQNELFPFLHASGVLFFSSNGHDGFGGMDIYVTESRDGKWVTPENMGSPVNTPANDFSMYMDRSMKDGYFSSDRDGGMGGDDIYSITINSEMSYLNSENIERKSQFDGTKVNAQMEEFSEPTSSVK